MSRRQPRQLAEGSRRWWARTMRDFALSVGKGTPKNKRPSMRGAAKACLYDRPKWARTLQKYEGWHVE